MNTINVLQLNLIHKTKGLEFHRGSGKNFEPKRIGFYRVLPEKKLTVDS